MLRLGRRLGRGRYGPLLHPKLHPRDLRRWLSLRLLWRPRRELPLRLLGIQPLHVGRHSQLLWRPHAHTRTKLLTTRTHELLPLLRRAPGPKLQIRSRRWHDTNSVTLANSNALIRQINRLRYENNLQRRLDSHREQPYLHLRCALIVRGRSRRNHAHHPRRLCTHNRAAACQKLSIYPEHILPNQHPHNSRNTTKTSSSMGSQIVVETGLWRTHHCSDGSRISLEMTWRRNRTRRHSRRRRTTCFPTHRVQPTTNMISASIWKPGPRYGRQHSSAFTLRQKPAKINYCGEPRTTTDATQM